MAEHILGMGMRESVREIISMGEAQLAKVEGMPRRLVALSGDLDVMADRLEYSGPFTSYTLKFHVENGITEKVDAVLKDYPGLCEASVEDSVYTVKCPATEEGADSEKVDEAVDALSKCIKLKEIWRVHGENFRIDPISVELLFKAMVAYKASDVHLTPGIPPVFRVDNETRNSDIMPPLSAAQIRAMIKDICTTGEWQEFEETHQTSFNYHQVGHGYSRVSAFVKGGAPHCTFRYLPENIPSFEDLHIPAETMKQLAKLHHGLVLVTGMTGSGKTTTVAALVDWINSTKTCHILCIENPVEFVHRNRRSIVSQRNTGKDVRNFNEAVTASLRHDPDVIVIGEMRDPDTIRSAISAAATGHLVISTLHSNTASEVINRIISFFDPVERDLVRLQLRDSIRCIICQRLVPRTGGGRVPALEIMFNDIKAINDSIVLGDTDGIRVGMQQTVSHSFIFEHYLHTLYKEGIVELDMARQHATEVSILDQMVMGTYSVPRLDAIKAAKAAGSGKH